MTIAAFAGGGSSSPAPAARAAATPARDGLAVWTAQGCGSCHTFAPAGSSGPIGPDLEGALVGKDREYVKRKIVAPRAGYAMPEDYATRISPPDLDRLVDFLLSAQ
jgi:mono/diheme cytochrome c family protein